MPAPAETPYHHRGRNRGSSQQVSNDDNRKSSASNSRAAVGGGHTGTPASLNERWSDERFQDMAEIWRLSQEDQQKMRLLQHDIADIDHYLNDPYEVIRYFNEYKVVAQAAKMFRNMIQWRKEKDMDNFLENYGGAHPLFHQMPVAILDAVDKDGDPIYLDRVGAADSWGLYKEFGVGGMVDYILYTRELCNTREFWKDYEDRVGHRVRNSTVIIDVHGLNSGHMRPGLLAVLQQSVRPMQDYYSGWGKRIILLRAPAIFKIIWRVAKHFFDQHIQDMIVLTNHSDYLEVVQQYVDLEALPACIAPGKGKGKPLQGTYFEKVDLSGGPLRKILEDEFEPPLLSKAAPARKDTDQTMMSTASSVDCYSECGDESETTTTSVCSSATVLMKGFWKDEPAAAAAGRCRSLGSTHFFFDLTPT